MGKLWHKIRYVYTAAYMANSHIKYLYAHDFNEPFGEREAIIWLGPVLPRMQIRNKKDNPLESLRRGL